jgi:hypothetical protein
MSIRRAIASIMKDYIELANLTSKQFDFSELLSIVNTYMKLYHNRYLNKNEYESLHDAVFKKMDHYGD